MKYYQLLANIFSLKLNFAALLCLLVVGCQIFEPPSQQVLGGQPGDYLIAALESAQVAEKHDISDVEQISAVLQSSYQGVSIPRSTIEILKKHPELSAKLVKSLSQGFDLEYFVSEQTNKDATAQQTAILLGLKLFPIDSYRTIEALRLNDKIKTDDIVAAGLSANLDPTVILPASAAQNELTKIEPLFHSASVTLFNQQQSNSAQIQYRKIDSNDWFDALPLQWEPIRGALSGSIVRLQADTEYELYITLLDNGNVIDNIQQTFQTRSETPPINPNLVYQLADIYNGGQLDLAALNIQGEADGWAKIIGDANTVIEAYEIDDQAINIGDNSYIYFENITVKGGRRHAIRSNRAHHLWFNGCNVSGWGRKANFIKNGKSYENDTDTWAINYDAGFYLEKSGVIVIENCEVHSPNIGANNWGSGHPSGATALLAAANHPNEDYQGQHVIRYNRFYGSDEKRFNDVIESRSNFRAWGGFVRDSAIHDNYLAYANDDIIELDGGQSNVLFYNNELTQGFCGISVAPNMLGPSYLFNNYIHDLGDDRDKEWTAIKMGGLISRPAGITNLFENLIIINNNGVAGSGVDNDRTFWLNAQNNIIISKKNGGRGIYDREFYQGSVFKNNAIYNTAYGAPFVQATIGDDFYHPSSEQADKIDEIVDSNSSFNLESDIRFIIPNFTRATLITSSEAAFSSSFASVELINFNDRPITSFDAQDKDNNYEVTEGGDALTLYGNTWKSVEITQTITPQTIVEFELKSNGAGEIVGIAFENDNKLTSSRLYKFAGSQNWNNDLLKYDNSGEFETISLLVGQFSVGNLDRLVFVMDDDKPSSTVAQVTFKNLKFYELEEAAFSSSSESVELINFDDRAITSFDAQDKDNNYEVTEGGDALTLYGNTWKSVEITQTITPQTIIKFEIKSNGAGEIAGIAFENDNKLTNSRLYKFAGSQNWNKDSFKYSNTGEFETISLPVGQFLVGDLNRLVLVMDDDKPSSTVAQVTFKNLKFYELEPVEFPKGSNGSTIRVGLSSEK